MKGAEPVGGEGSKVKGRRALILGGKPRATPPLWAIKRRGSMPRALLVGGGSRVGELSLELGVQLSG